MANRERKSGRQKYKNVNISRTKKNFLDEIKTFFIIISGLSLDEKCKKAGTGFKKS